MKYSVIIPSAGVGSRMGCLTPKVFLTCGSAKRTILQTTIRTFASDPDCELVVACVPIDWIEEASRQVSEWPHVSVVAGGDSRQASVRMGLHFLCHMLGRREDSIVLVHDGARCLVSIDAIHRVIETVVLHGAATAAVPVVDSIVRSALDVIESSVDREHMWAVQTPQGFILRDLLVAHDEALARGIAAMDDASLVRASRPVWLVQGDRFNIKVTTPDDLRMIELMRVAG